MMVFVPQVDVCERPSEIVILVELPGVDRTDVVISWKDNVLTVSGQKRQRSEAGARFMCVERSYGPFRREIEVNMPVDHQKAKAELRDGLMRIRLPRTVEDSEGSTIPIE